MDGKHLLDSKRIALQHIVMNVMNSAVKTATKSRTSFGRFYQKYFNSVSRRTSLQSINQVLDKVFVYICVKLNKYND